MATIRHSIKRIPTILRYWTTTIRTERTMYTNWHLKDMNLQDGMAKDEKLKDLWHRRQLVGPEELKPRSQQFLWNYDAELFAFGKRLGEEMKKETLKTVFRHASYESTEEETESTTASTSNDAFIGEGAELIDSYAKAYLRFHFPRLPEEGIRAVANHLTSDEQLSHLANHLGMFDLVLAANFPYDEKTMADTFKAVVGGLKADSGAQQAEYFVQDFVLTFLNDLNLNEVFYSKNPGSILAAILEKKGDAAPEARILRQTGVFTVTPTYLVGIYVNEKLLGQGAGESTQIAEDMASRDCLAGLWGTRYEQRMPPAFGQRGHELDLSDCKTRENEWLRETVAYGDERELLGDAFPEDPFQMDRMYTKYKEEIEPALGITYRRKQKHAFFHGSVNRRNPRPFIRPNVKTI